MKKMVVVGGGTAGWFTAAAFSKLKHLGYDVTLIESLKISKIGVGESVTPHVQYFFDMLEIDTHEWMRETGAVYKLANKFVGWMKNHDPEYFSFTYPFDVKNLLREEVKPTAREYWPVSRDSYSSLDLMASYLSSGQLDKFDRYFCGQYHYMEKNVAPFDDKKYLLNPLLTWSQHINAEKCADFVRDRVALPNGVEHIKADVVEVISKGDNIRHLVLDDGRTITGDLFIDASGFHRVLIKNLGWKEKIYNNSSVDSAWVCQIDYDDPEIEMVNYTQSIAQPHGWVFKIGLYHRMGVGYCFSSNHVSQDDALAHYKSLFKNRRFEPRLIKWRPSRLEKMSKGNVVSIGLSSGFIEPLEANALFIITNGIYRLIAALDRQVPDMEKFNSQMAYTIDDICDFILVHYTLSDRNDTDFWNDMRAVGQQQRHSDLLLEKYLDPRNSMTGALDGWTLFPNYMWLQLASSWKQDLTPYINDNVSDFYKDLGMDYFQFTERKNKMISQSRQNNYLWLKQNVFNDMDFADWEKKYLR
jgi:tryptophan halogenase